MTRVRAFFTGFNNLGSFLLPAFFLFLVQTNFKSRLLYLLLSFLVGLAIIFTLSRNAVLGLLLGGLVYYLTNAYLESSFVFFKKLFLLIFGSILIVLLIHYGSEYSRLLARYNVLDFLALQRFF